MTTEGNSTDDDPISNDTEQEGLGIENLQLGSRPNNSPDRSDGIFNIGLGLPMNFNNRGSDFSKPFKVSMIIEDENVLMELDTGSPISAIADRLYKSKFSHIPLQTTDLILRSYDGREIKPLGFVNVKVKYEDKVRPDFKLYVIFNGGPALLGRDCLSSLNVSKLNLNNMCVPSVHSNAM